MQAAIIGCGFIANSHAQAIKELGQTLALVIDLSRQKAEDFARDWKADRFGDSFPSALEEGIQCVHICTPPTLHYSMVKEALKAGKHVICEKPLCVNPEQGAELVKIAQERNLVNAVNFNVRFMTPPGKPGISLALLILEKSALSTVLIFKNFTPCRIITHGDINPNWPVRCAPPRKSAPIGLTSFDFGLAWRSRKYSRIMESFRRTALSKMELCIRIRRMMR